MFIGTNEKRNLFYWTFWRKNKCWGYTQRTRTKQPMKLLMIQRLFFLAIPISFILYCTTAKPVDIKKQNPKLYRELIRDYSVVSEENPGKIETLKFIENETQSIVGKINNFPIESCTWFFDRKVKDKNNLDDTMFLQKAINLNCGGQYYIIELDKQNIQANKLKYQGVYKGIFDQLRKAIIVEASCSIYSTTNKEEDDKNTAIECYPYPYDLERYTKNQKREVVAGYFLYTENQESLESLMMASKEEKDNTKVLQELKKDFVSETDANNQKTNPSIGKNFTFKNCEYIDFREAQTLNKKGKDLKAKIDKFVESDLTDPTNKESLRDAIEEYRTCGNRCYSKDKEIQILFEIKNEEAKRKTLIIKKLSSRSELSKYKRFNFYPVEGSLKSIDFSVKGDIEKIYLDPIIETTPTQSDIKPEPSKVIEEVKKAEEEEKTKEKKKKKSKITETVVQPIPEPDAEGNTESVLPKQE